ncbi:hypothetical protein ACHAXR_007082 [Thalassiosira sp. AJA248-18]
MDSSDDNSSSSSGSTPPITMDEYDDDLPFNLLLKGDDQAENEEEGHNDGGFNWAEDEDNIDDGFDSAVGSVSTLNQSEREPDTEDTLCRQHDNTAATASASIYSEAMQPAPSSTQEVSSASSLLAVPHRGSLRRILNPSSFTTENAIQTPSNPPTTPSSWPMYAINVALESSTSQYSHNKTEAIFESDHHQLQSYQIIFERQQYEFCTRLFALLDTESQSAIGPDCIRKFVCLHCPVVRRRDGAIFALQGSEETTNDNERSPTFDEIWEKTIHSDLRSTSADSPSPAIHRIGIEGWMVFCRLLALAHHQESQRRFASRHLQQMMRHKHGGGANRMNPSEVVVMVDNPPPGPPSLISIRALVDVEQERVTSNRCIQGWPFCPLPLPDLDLDHRLASLSNNNPKTTGLHNHQGMVSIEPFTSSQEGDFILRFHNNDSRTTVVRRSYSDFEWLNTTLKLHKRPGQGHLCGRILPPFPSKQGSFNQQHSLLSKKTLSSGPSAQHSQKDISERAIAAAKSGMGMISSLAKSVLSGYVPGSTPSSSPSSALSKNKGKIPSPKLIGPDKGRDVPTMVAHRLERYLNYLLENNALSTSFPLNAILQASQSGLESAKQTLHDHTKHKKRQRSNLIATTLRGGPHSASSIFSVLVSKTTASLSRLQDDDDTPWLRAAAQVAMSLQFHGILETTGHESTSAKIQHASLPKFRNHPGCSWDDEEPGNDEGTNSGKTSQRIGSSDSDSPRSETFETGVINVESGLLDEEDLGGYDMLPSPGPSEEHRVLNAGSAVRGKIGSSKSQPTKSRFIYETAAEQFDGMHNRKEAVLGSIRVDSDIDKLRDIIRSINRTLGQLYQSSLSIQLAHGARNAIQLDLLRAVDSWGDSGGEVISQRALVGGVAELEAFSSATEDNNKAMADDFLWQSSLATSAVAAVTEVRDAVRASHTASRAKSAAFMAAEKAKKAYESCDHSSSKENIQHTQSEASNAQSHAIHATVVEYEANIAKKRSAVSLAQDVKSWNLHRKRDLLQTCIQVAKSQRDASRKAADAWESLRDGLIDSSVCSFANDGINMWPVFVAPTITHANTQEIVSQELPSKLDVSDGGEFIHDHLSPNNLESSSSLHDWEGNGQQDFAECAVEASNSASSIADGIIDTCSWKESQQSNSEVEVSSDNVYCLSPPSISQLDEDYFSFHQGIAAEANSDSDENEDDHTSTLHESFHSGHDANGESMSMSMQSLIDGLMAWGEEGEQKNEETDKADMTTTGLSNDVQHNKLLE